MGQAGHIGPGGRQEGSYFAYVQPQRLCIVVFIVAALKLGYISM
jgi:hypothetical protein